MAGLVFVPPVQVPGSYFGVNHACYFCHALGEKHCAGLVILALFHAFIVWQRWLLEGFGKLAITAKQRLWRCTGLTDFLPINIYL